MEWIPKLIDDLDSAGLGLYQAAAGYYLWVFLRLLITIVAVTAITVSPTIRLMAIAVVTTYACLIMMEGLILRRKCVSAIREQG